MASTDARPVPIGNTAYRAVFPIYDKTGALVPGAAGLDSEVSKDQGTYADCTNEATEIATSSGTYYLDLTASEMNADCVSVIVKTSTTDAKTTVLVLYPQETGDIKVDVQSFGGSAGTFASGRPEVNTTHAAGTAWGSGAITAASIASDAITAAKIADGAIDAGALASDTITAAKIATGAITAAKFAAGAIDAAAIAADAITDAKVASDVTIASVTGAVGSVTGAVGSVTGNVGGNVTGSVGSIATGGITTASFAAGAINAAAIAADAITDAKVASDVTIASVTGAVGSVTGAVGSVTGNIGGNVAGSVGSVTTVSDKTGYRLSATGVDDILDDVVEGSYTFRHFLRLFAAALGGKLSGAATTTVTIRNASDTKAVITATVDADGNRSAVTLDLT